MTKDELIARLSDVEWEDFKVKEARTNVPKNSLKLDFVNYNQ